MRLDKMFIEFRRRSAVFRLLKKSTLMEGVGESQRCENSNEADRDSGLLQIRQRSDAKAARFVASMGQETVLAHRGREARLVLRLD
jgi:hypothetical protein